MRPHRHDYYSLNRWVALVRNVVLGLREVLRAGSLAAFVVRNRIRRGSLLELDSILASLASDAGVRVEALYSAPPPRVSGPTSSPGGLEVAVRGHGRCPQALGWERKEAGFGDVLIANRLSRGEPRASISRLEACAPTFFARSGSASSMNLLTTSLLGSRPSYHDGLVPVFGPDPRKGVQVVGREADNPQPQRRHEASRCGGPLRSPYLEGTDDR